MDTNNRSVLTHNNVLLSSLEKDKLVDLLQHSTQLLITASITKIPDKEYVETLREEVERIQEEIKRRMRM